MAKAFARAYAKARRHVDEDIVAPPRRLSGQAP